MKRMVKNGDLLDISEDGSGVSFGGNLKVGGTIIANGEIRGGDVSAGKFYLGTEEMPLVKANPAGEATQTLEKVKIGNVAYNVGGGSSERVLTLVVPYSKDDNTQNKKTYVDDEIYQKISNFFYETIKLYFNDGNPLGIFHLFYYNDQGEDINSQTYVCISDNNGSSKNQEWYGSNVMTYWFAYIQPRIDINDNRKYLRIYGNQPQSIPELSKAKFDALYKLADKPTQDGTYVLKATVSGGAVTYTWVSQ